MSTPMPSALTVNFPARRGLQPPTVWTPVPKAAEGCRTPKAGTCSDRPSNSRSVLEYAIPSALLNGPRKEFRSDGGKRTEMNSESSIQLAYSSVVILHAREHFAHGVFPTHKNCA